MNGDIQHQKQDEPSDLRMKPDSEESNLGLYKFKSNIRQRFDLQDHQEVGRPRLESVGSDTEQENHAGLPKPRSRFDLGRPVIHDRFQPSSRFQDSGLIHPRAYSGDLKAEPEIKLSQSPPPSALAAYPPSHSPAQRPQTIPIFALNSKSSYYVPMSVDISVITPFLSLYNEDTCPLLHPVTISVNFQVTEHLYLLVTLFTFLRTYKSSQY